MEKKINIRGKKFFICEYTGALISKRYFYISNKEKVGCFATLPILLRYLYDSVDAKEFAVKKRELECQYFQPAIPIQPILLIDRVPLDELGLFTYLEEIDKGSAWLKVAGAEVAD